ncbi:hypothetical protein VNO78_09974 [Psophocarpus tetragonolobus]|uniref:Uncharacterized protein n=1 Tax=Psophocarpus tetragonolobus TaxID=3891 RepID=A0AAN9XM39_PSOTE
MGTRRRRAATRSPSPRSSVTSTPPSSLERSLSFHLGNKLCSSTLLYDLFLNAFATDPSLRAARPCLRLPLSLPPQLQRLPRLFAQVEDGISRSQFQEGFLLGTGTSSYQVHRLAHVVWRQRPLALALHSWIKTCSHWTFTSSKDWERNSVRPCHWSSSGEDNSDG